MRYVRANLHELLIYARTDLPRDQEDLQGAYNRANLLETARSYSELIKQETRKSTGEETVQKFIEANSILLACFTPQQEAFKPPIGSCYKTDFAVLNQRNELLLIEIEKPSTKLFKTKGGQHSEITQAFDQVEDWLTVARRNRLSLLDNLGMNLSLDDVKRIRGVVIAGRSDKGNLEHIEKLLVRNSDIDFYTFDDLLGHLRTVIRSMDDL